MTSLVKKTSEGRDRTGRKVAKVCIPNNEALMMV